MEIVAAREDVGAGETLERKVGSVGAATNGLHHRFHAHGLHGLLGQCHHVEDGLHLFAHIIILVFKFAGDTFAVFSIQVAGDVLHELLLLFKFGTVVVADDVGETGVLHCAFHVNEQVEAFVILGVLGLLGFRQHAVELHGNQLGVHHLIFRIAGVNVSSLNLDVGAGGIEVLILQFADGTTVHGIGEIATESFDIEILNPLSNLFIGGEAHADFAVLDFGMGQQKFHGRHDFSDAGFVVRTQQGLAVGYQQGLSLVVSEFWKVGEGELGMGFGIQQDVFSVIVLNDARLFGTGHVGGRVEVRDETDYRQLHVAVGGQGGCHIAVFVFLHFRKTDPLQFFYQKIAEDKLVRGARIGGGVFIRGGGDGHVTGKPLQ